MDKLVELLFETIKKENVHPAYKRSALIRAGQIAHAYAVDTQIDEKLCAEVFGPTIPEHAQESLPQQFLRRGV
jgi:hypothetical protein